MVAGVLLSGCTKNELSPVSPSELGAVGSEYVSFLPVSGLASTKATTGPADSTFYPTDWTFGTFAVYSDRYDSVYINNKEVLYTGKSTNGHPTVNDNEENVWRTAEAYVWLKSHTLDFFSYSPYDSLNTRVKFKNKAITIDNFRVYNHPQAAGAKVAGQFDVMVATPATNYGKNGSAYMYNGEKPHKYTYTGVPTVFNHKLAYIDSVQVNTDTNYLAESSAIKKTNTSGSTAEYTINTVAGVKYYVDGVSETGDVSSYIVGGKNVFKDNTVHGAFIDSVKIHKHSTTDADSVKLTYLCVEPKIMGIVFDSIYVRGSYQYAQNPAPAYSEWTPTATDENDSTVWYGGATSTINNGGIAIGYAAPNDEKTPKAGKFKNWTTIPGPNNATSTSGAYTENGYLFVLPQTLGAVDNKKTARLKVYYSVQGYYVFLTGAYNTNNNNKTFDVGKVEIQKFNDGSYKPINSNQTNYSCRTITLSNQTAGNIAEGKTNSNPASWDVNKRISYYLTFGYKGTDGAFDIIYWAPNVAPWEEEGWTATVSVNDK